MIEEILKELREKGRIREWASREILDGLNVGTAEDDFHILCIGTDDEGKIIGMIGTRPLPNDFEMEGSPSHKVYCLLQYNNAGINKFVYRRLNTLKQFKNCPDDIMIWTEIVWMDDSGNYTTIPYERIVGDPNHVDYLNNALGTFIMREVKLTFDDESL